VLAKEHVGPIGRVTSENHVVLPPTNRARQKTSEQPQRTKWRCYLSDNLLGQYVVLHIRITWEKIAMLPPTGTSDSQVGQSGRVKYDSQVRQSGRIFYDNQEEQSGRSTQTTK